MSLSDQAVALAERVSLEFKELHATVESLLARIRVLESAGTAGGITVVDNGDGTYTLTGTYVSEDTETGLVSLTGPDVTENPDGTVVIAA